MGVAHSKKKCISLGWSPPVRDIPTALRYSTVGVACVNFYFLTVSALSYLAIFSLYTVNSEQIERELYAGMEHKQFFLCLILNMGTSGDARCALEHFIVDVQ